MTITTKFDKNEYVFVMWNDKIVQRKINLIKWNSVEGVYYVMVGNDEQYRTRYPEKEVFKTKEELIATL